MFEFLDFDYLSNGEIDLKIVKKEPANEEINYVPAYIYNIYLHNGIDSIGEINLRIGNNEGIYYGGHIGYCVNKDYRGHHYAAMACNLIKQVAQAHGMTDLFITCNPDNIPSRKTCERIGAKLIEIVDLPEHNDMYKDGERHKCRYQLAL